jgi:hypothetical protein
MTQIVVANHIAYHSLGSSSALNAIVDDLAAKVTQHTQQADYLHPDFTNATAISNPSSPGALSLVRRDVNGQAGFVGLTVSPGANSNGLLIQLPAGVQVPAYAVLTILKNGGGLAASFDQYGSLIAANGLFTGNDTAGATNALGVRSSAAPAGDIFYVGDNGGTAANRYLRVNSSGQVIGRLGLYVGLVGSELLAVDANGNILNRRSHREFTVTLSPTALSVTVATGKYVDSNGLPVLVTTQPPNPVSHATLWVWWTLSYGIGGVVHFTANNAGGNVTQGSATKANFPPGDLPIGYVQVPPNVTNLANAVFDDWRGTQTGDGNTGAGGGVAITTSMITDVDEHVAYANSKQLAAIASGAATVTGPPGNTGAAILAAHLRSGDRGGGDFDANLASRLGNDTSPNFEAQIGSSTNSMSITCGVNFPSWISITGRWRFLTATATATTSGGAGTRYLIADLSGTGPGYTIALSTSNAVGSFQKVIADQYFDGTNFVGALNTSYVKKLGAAQYTPTDYQSATNPTALGASLVAGITGGPSISIPTTIAAKAWISFVVSHSGSAIGRTQFQLINNVNGTGFAAIFPYSEVEYLTSGQVNRGTATLSRYVILTPGTNVYQIGGVAASGTGVTPNAAYLYALVYGA